MCILDANTLNIQYYSHFKFYASVSILAWMLIKQLRLVLLISALLQTFPHYSKPTLPTQLVHTDPLLLRKRIHNIFIANIPQQKPPNVHTTVVKCTDPPRYHATQLQQTH